MDDCGIAENADLSSSTNIRIGVLGGIGPEATVEFYGKLIKRLQEKNLIRNNCDFPQIIINSIPAPELIHDTISEADLKPYINGIRLLDKTGVDFIVMVCNTIHLYYERLQGQIKTPILDLREEVEKCLASKGIKSVCIIGTPNTLKNGLYRFEGIKYLDISKSEILELSRSIFNFNRGFNMDRQVKTVNEICKKYVKKKSNAVILACTELAIMLSPFGKSAGGKGKNEISIINTIDVLVEATIDKFLSLKYAGRQKSNQIGD